MIEFENFFYSIDILKITSNIMVLILCKIVGLNVYLLKFVYINFFKIQLRYFLLGSSSEIEKTIKTNTVTVPKIDDESFTSFFKSVKERIGRISVSTFDLSDDVFEYLSSETHQL